MQYKLNGIDDVFFRKLVVGKSIKYYETHYSKLTIFFHHFLELVLLIKNQKAGMYIKLLICTIVEVFMQMYFILWVLKRKV